MYIEDKGDWGILYIEERETGEFCILKTREAGEHCILRNFIMPSTNKSINSSEIRWARFLISTG